jgi:hypothetical protein
MPGTNSSLLQKFVNYGRKKFYNISHRSEVVESDKHTSLHRKRIKNGRKKFFSACPRVEKAVHVLSCQAKFVEALSVKLKN